MLRLAEDVPQILEGAGHEGRIGYALEDVMVDSEDIDGGAERPGQGAVRAARKDQEPVMKGPALRAAPGSILKS